MKDLALYALLSGVSHTSKLHNVEEATVKRWIRDLDFGNDPFFAKLRELVLKCSTKAGREKAQEMFSVPRWTLEVLEKHFPQEKTNFRELKKSALKMHLQEKTPEEISEVLGINSKPVSKWIQKFQKLKCKKEEPGPPKVSLDKIEAVDDFDSLFEDAIK